MASTSMLTLDATTLFYFNLSAIGREKNQGEPPAVSVERWSATVDSELATANPFSSKLPSLTHGSSRPSRSALTGSAALITGDETRFQDGGIVSDEDETDGPERLRAVMSPAKGERRVTSSVMCTLTSLKLDYTYSLTSGYSKC